jgi:hypothetical protein
VKRFYRALLWLYPEAYRNQFGEQLELVFDDLCQEELSRHGRLEAGFWGWVIADTLRGAAVEQGAALTDQGMKRYLQTTLHVNRFNVLGLLLLTPFFVMLGVDGLGRIAQGDLLHPNQAWYAVLARTPLYTFPPALFSVVLLLPALAMLINCIPILSRLRQYRHNTLTLGQVVSTNLVALAIMGLGLSFVALALWHDVVPCMARGILSGGLSDIRHVIAVCRNA